MIELKLNDLVVFEGRVYRVVKSPFHTRNEKLQTYRVILKLLQNEELNKLLIENENNKNEKLV